MAPTNPPAATLKPEGFATPEEALASTRPLQEKLGEVAGKTPSTVVEAFMPTPIKIGGIELKPITLRTWIFLEKIKSPLIHGRVEDVNIEDLVRALYVISQPPEDVDRAIYNGDLAFRVAVGTFADEIPAADLRRLTGRLAEHVRAEFAPRADMVREEEGSGTGPKPQAS